MVKSMQNIVKDISLSLSTQRQTGEILMSLTIGLTINFREPIKH